MGNTDNGNTVNMGSNNFNTTTEATMTKRSKANTRQAIVEAINTINASGGTATARTISEAVPFHLQTVRRHLQQMRETGTVAFTGCARLYVYGSQDAQSGAGEQGSAAQAVLDTLAQPLGVFEIGSKLRVKRQVAQGTLDSLVAAGAVVRARSAGRWIYRRAS